MKTVLIQRVLPRYREPLFEELSRQCHNAGMSFNLWVSPAEKGFAARGTEGDLLWAKSLPIWQLGPARFGIEWQRLPWRDLMKADAVIVPDNVRVLSNVAVIWLRRLFSKPVITWGHGVNFQPSGGARKLFARLRSFLLRPATRHLVYTSVCIEPMVRQGFDAQRIHLSHNAIDASPAADLTTGHPDVIAFRQAHGLGVSPCVIFLGSWYASKRPERIIEIGQLLREDAPDTQVLVIGGGEAIESLRKAKAPWLHLLGPLHGRDKYIALAASRCLAVTGIAGLNLLDAMAVALPVVVPKREDHSPEIAFVKHEVNGLLTEDKSEEIAKACCQLLEKEELWCRLSDGALITAGELTIEKMASNLLAPLMIKSCP